MTKDPNFVSVRLPDDVANWLREYATTNKLVRADKPNMGGSIISIVRAAMQGQTISNNVGQPSATSDIDIEAMVDTAIAKQLDDRDRVINLAIGSMRELFETAIAENSAATAALLKKFEALEATVSAKKSIVSIARQKVLAA